LPIILPPDSAPVKPFLNQMPVPTLANMPT
jgi:hypothetical protein